MRSPPFKSRALTFGFTRTSEAALQIDRDLDRRRLAEPRANLLAATYRQHAGHRAGADRFPGAKPVAPLAALFGQPPQRPQRIAHDVGADALAAQCPVDLKPD